MEPKSLDLCIEGWKGGRKIVLDLRGIWRPFGMQSVTRVDFFLTTTRAISMSN